MKHNYWGLWLLLFVAFAAVAAASVYGPVMLGSYQLRDSGFRETLFEQKDLPDVEVSPVAADTLIDEAVAVAPAPVDTNPKTLLFIGDSMLEGLSPRLAAYAKHNGHTLYSVIWYSSTSMQWGQSKRLADYIERIKPDFIFISLGANELFVKDITTKRDGYVKHILADIGSCPYLWIGPPNWKPDTGINDLVAANAAKGCFFLSNGMHFDRASDGAHPTRSSAVLWMDSVIRWMAVNSPHPFRMEVPDVKTASPARVFIHQPGE